MTTAHCWAIPVVLVLLLSPSAPGLFPAPSYYTGDEFEISAESTGNGYQIEKEGNYSQDPGSSGAGGSGSGVGVSESVVVDS